MEIKETEKIIKETLYIKSKDLIIEGKMANIGICMRKVVYTDLILRLFKIIAK